MKVLSTILALLLLASPALAQTGSSKSPTALTTETNTLWPDNNAGQITPFNARQTLLDIIASYANLNLPLVGSVSNSDGTLTITPITGAVVASIALAHANTWTAIQTFSVSPLVPTASPGTNNTQAASTAFVQAALGGAGTLTSVTCNGGLTGGTFTTTGTCAVDVATNSNIWGGTANKIIDAAGAQTSVAVTAQAISTATFTPNFANYINFSITLSGACPCTLANPSGAYNGLTGFIEVIQDGSGSRTITTYGSTWKFSGGTKPTLSTTASAKDVLPFFCDSSTFCMVGAIQTAFQ